MAATDDAPFKFFRYNPSLAAAILFTICFLASAMMHLYQLLRTTTWIMIPLFVGGCFEAIGYIARIISAAQTPNWTLGPYIVSAILLLVAPALFAASIYMELGRIILAVDGEHAAVIKKKWLTKVFVLGDVLSFLMQASGGGIMANKSQSSQELGSNIIVGGLIVQILFFSCFVLIGVIFNSRIARKPTAQSVSAEIPWQKHLRTLYSVSALILVRSIFRVVEFLQGNAGFIMSHEVFLYIFDAVLMFAVTAILNFVHPSVIYALLKGGKTTQGYLLRTAAQGTSLS